MLALTKKAGYALIAMTHLASLPEAQVASAREIAGKFGVPKSLLMNVLKELATAGYVESLRGARGGYRLKRRPEQINLADLIAVLEGPVRLVECVTGQAGGKTKCSIRLMARCPIADPIHRVHRRINEFLKNVTLAEIVKPTLKRPAKSAGVPLAKETSHGR